MYRMSGFRVGAHDDVRRIRVMASFARVGLTLPVGKALLRPKNLGAVDLLCSRRALHSSFRLRLTTSSDVPGGSTSVTEGSPSEPGAIIDEEFLAKPGTIMDEEILAKLVPDLHNLDPRDSIIKSGAIPRNVPPGAHQELPIMHVKVTHNNTIFTISDAAGKVLAWTSAGAEGFNNARRGTTFAAQTAATAAARKALALGLQKFQVKLKGTGAGRSSSLKGLEMGGIVIQSIQDVTPVPHNGCKPRKRRRL